MRILIVEDEKKYLDILLRSLRSEGYTADGVGTAPVLHERLRAIALHARQLGFNHPMTNEPVDVVAPLSVAWEEILRGRL